MKILKRIYKKVYADETLEYLSTQIPRGFGSMNSLIIHTVLFGYSYFLILIGYNKSNILDLVTNIVSLEAIYLSMFILMSANLQLRKLHDVADNVRDIQEDVDEIQVDVKEIQEDVDEIQEDIDEINEDDDLERIEKTLNILIKEINTLKNRKK